MRIASVEFRGVKPYGGWFKERYGDHVMQMSTDTSLKLKAAVRDVARMLHRACADCGNWALGDIDYCPSCKRATFGFVPDDTEQWCKRFTVPPMGVTDHHFVLGYDVEGEGWQQGSIETDEALKAYVEAYPDDWAIVKEALGLARQKGRHPCLPAGERVIVRTGKRCGRALVDIVEADGLEVYTGGRGRTAAKAKLLDQGEAEVFEYSLDNGKKIRATANHLVLTIQGWMQIGHAAAAGVELVRARQKIILTEQDAQTYAETRGGKLIGWSHSVKKPSTWQCAAGHVWQGGFGRMFSYEHWCRACSHRGRFGERKRYLSPERQARKQLGVYRRHDQKHGRTTTVDINDIIEAREAKCIYCARTATGLERVDNDLGHTKENCVPACMRCNWMRGRYVTHEVMKKVGQLLTEIDP